MNLRHEQRGWMHDFLNWKLSTVCMLLVFKWCCVLVSWGFGYYKKMGVIKIRFKICFYKDIRSIFSRLLHSVGFRLIVNDACAQIEPLVVSPIWQTKALNSQVRNINHFCLKGYPGVVKTYLVDARTKVELSQGRVFRNMGH
jgi:hypothetical protein